jgi:glycosyltransferase involved in cell wall biosynthesis
VKILSPTASAEKFYKMADIFLLPSIYEPFGQTLLEAQASGLPVVAFSNIVEGVNTATNDVVINSTSVLAKDLNVESLAECIQHASRKINTGYFDRHHISMYAKDRFSWENTVDDIVSVDNGHS